MILQQIIPQVIDQDVVQINPESVFVSALIDGDTVTFNADTVTFNGDADVTW